ncbi:O-GlcNAc transferase, C-terminal [Cinara cedri]|uniref:O-GlcNAc transferase, C-terminal n=1 Tax=Cinara cedri TaxID=506608 RepID=A0A5E4MIK9_9HEMI|nr:O-GlcNAc transferase, C-terminal [Cinara cedri]
MPRSNDLSASDCCIDISNLSSIDAAKKINADRIHILIDVGDSTKDLEYEIFALKPAPIQVKLLGHPGTSGATFIDYLITDKQCSPPNLNYLYTEKLAYLNRTVFFGDHRLLFNDLSQRNSQNRTNFNETMCNFESFNTSSMYSVEKLYTRQMYNLPENSIVYCYFGQPYKINQTTLNMWITILKGVKNSVLWLLRFVEDTENNIREYFELNGINPVRIIFSNLAPKAEHLRRIQLADVYLDTPFYNGHKSCLDALWAGTPIVTLSGDSFVSRMTTSQLLAVNCTELIALVEFDYPRIAIQLGKHTNLLNRIRQQIWRSKITSALFDCESYCRELENLYLDMWKKLF